jgi:hypothetical protein
MPLLVKIILLVAGVAVLSVAIAIGLVIAFVKSTVESR